LTILFFDSIIVKQYMTIRYGCSKLIENFKCKETRKIWDRQFSKKFPADIQKTARRKLIAISISDSVQDLRQPPSNHLKKLEGERKGQYSIRINDQWRICFKWNNGNAFDVEITDYH